MEVMETLTVALEVPWGPLESCCDLQALASSTRGNLEREKGRKEKNGGEGSG